MYSHFVSYLGFRSTEEDQIRHGATLYVAYPMLSTMPVDALATWGARPSAGMALTLQNWNILSPSSEELLYMHTHTMSRKMPNTTICFINLLAPGRCGSHFTSATSEHMLRIKFMSTACEIALRRMPLNTFDYQSTLVQVMVWCHQVTSHYLSQC